MSQLYSSASLRMAVAVMLLGLLVGCRRSDPDEARPGGARESRPARVVDRAVEQAREKLREDTAATAGKAEGRAVPSSPDGVQPPAGYVLMRAKAQLDESRGNALLLVDEPEKHVVPIFIGGTEALSISLRLAGQHYARPLTHDLLDTLLRRLGAKLESSQIDELRDNTFIGTVVVRDRDGQVLHIDARPSDAVALAIGNKVPIFMAQTVIDRAGLRIDELDKQRPRPGGSARVEPTRL